MDKENNNEGQNNQKDQRLLTHDEDDEGVLTIAESPSKHLHLRLTETEALDEMETDGTAFESDINTENKENSSTVANKNSESLHLHLSESHKESNTDESRKESNKSNNGELNLHLTESDHETELNLHLEETDDTKESKVAQDMDKKVSDTADESLKLQLSNTETQGGEEDMEVGS